MKERRVPRGLACLLCISLLLTSTPARATDSLKTTGEEIVAGIVGVSVAIGVIIGLTIHHVRNPSIKGCVTSGPGGLQITTEGDNKTYQLIGTTGDIKPDQVVNLKGRKKSAKGAPPAFDVDKVKKTYGACSASPTP